MEQLQWKLRRRFAANATSVSPLAAGQINTTEPVDRHIRQHGSVVRHVSRRHGASVTQSAQNRAEGTNTHATVTRVLQCIEKTQEIRAGKTVLGVEIYSRYGWEDRVSSGGLPIKVAHLRPSALVRR